MTERALALLAVVFACGACAKNNAPADDADEIFHTACARCHGPEGTGGPPDPFGNPGPRNFTDRQFQQSITDDQIKITIQNGKRGMPAFGAVFTPAQLGKLVLVVRAFGPSAASSASAPPSR